MIPPHIYFIEDKIGQKVNRLKILIIGGTGAMGAPLTECLSDNADNTVYVMVRHPRESKKSNLFYVQGNAFDYGSFVRTVSQGYDVIIDFMIWSPKKLKQRLDVIFASCGQYIALSTSSEYIGSNEIITEKTKRLYDIYNDSERRQTQRYHIKKSVDDDLITESPYHHWTIVRPWVTFNDRKCVLVTVPISVWLWRYLNDKTVVLPKRAMDKKCTFTYGGDVARAISKLVGNKKALGEIINIASDKTVTWSEVLEIYQNTLQEVGGKPLKVEFMDDVSPIWKDIPSQYDPITRDRYYNRSFSMEKLYEVCGGEFEFGDLKENVSQCIRTIVENPEQSVPNPVYNGCMDRMTHEHMPMDIFAGREAKLKFVVFRSPVLSRLYRMYRDIKGDENRFVYKSPDSDDLIS